MLPQRAEQGTTQAQAKQHKETGEVVDAHLQGLQVGHRHKPFMVMADPWGALAWRTQVGPETDLGLYSWIGRLGLHILEQGSKEGRALELGFCRMNRTAQKQTNTHLAYDQGIGHLSPHRLRAPTPYPHPVSQALSHLCDSKYPLPTRYHLVPLVMQQIDEAGGLIAADELGQVGGER